MQDANTKQQVAQRIKDVTNILVTVSRDPSVDELSAALALTLMLNKMDKHATAVFSGTIPPAIDFLEPGKTFENSVDSLRDFIIALDKNKADRLRYKVENDVVKVFITPYKTTISEKDLEFSQGDYNVQLILALNVEKREDLDAAIVAHGRILHDATTVTINTTDQGSSLGEFDWHDSAASSLCEMLMSLTESLQPNLVDEQIANALLTGIVAATERFSNQHTNPRVMTMAAQLMAAGANQQLIATKLEENNAIPPAQNQDGSSDLKEDQSSKVKPSASAESKADGEMVVEHETKESTPPNGDQKKAEDELEAALPVAPPNLPDLKEQLAEEQATPAQTPVTGPAQMAETAEKPSWMGKRLEPPTMGGTLNATTEQAHEDAEEEEEGDRNKTILSHDEPANTEAPTLPPVETPPMPAPEPNLPTDQAFPAPPQTPSLPEPPEIPHKVEDLAYEEAPAPASQPAQTLEQIEAEAKAAEATQTPAVTSPVPNLNDARDEVNAAFEAMPFDPANNPSAAIGAQPLPPLQHDLNGGFTEPPPAPLPTIQQHQEAMLPPMPDLSTLPPPPTDTNTPPADTTLPPANFGEPTAPGNNSVNTPPPPNQFQIPS